MAEYEILSPPGVSQLVAEAVLRLARATGGDPGQVAATVQKLTGFRFELIREDG